MMTIVYFYSHFAKRAGTERVLIEKNELVV